MKETTVLTPTEETAFQAWAKLNGITDINSPEASYDYRGFWKAQNGANHPPGSEQHFPDTFKQHGHPTFSIESQYSRGPFDGGRWLGESYVPPGADLLSTSRGSRLPTSQIRDALLALMQATR